MDLARKYYRPGDDYYILGKAAELRGELEEAVKFYRKAEKMGHDLSEPSDEYNSDEPIKPQEEKKPSLELEVENTLDISPQARAALAKYPHALDYHFTDEQKQFLDENGYLVIKNAVPRELCDAMVEEMWSRVKSLFDVEKDDPYTWAPLSGFGFVDMWHGNAYTQIRQHPVLYSIFTQLLQCAELTVSLDRVCMKPPAKATITQKDGTKKEISFKQAEVHIHNDMNLWDLQETKYQGGLALSECAIGHGGFRCIPGFHKLAKIRDYRQRYMNGEFHEISEQGSISAPRGNFVFLMNNQHDKAAALAKEIEMSVGDFVVWNSRLPHANCPNQSDQFRLQCYVRYLPTANHQQYTDEVAESVMTSRRPARFSTGGYTSTVDRELECKLHQKPQLTLLGSKLHGVSSWKS